MVSWQLLLLPRTAQLQAELQDWATVQESYIIFQFFATLPGVFGLAGNQADSCLLVVENYFSLNAS